MLPDSCPSSHSLTRQIYWSSEHSNTLPGLPHQWQASGAPLSLILSSYGPPIVGGKPGFRAKTLPMLKHLKPYELPEEQRNLVLYRGSYHQYFMPWEYLFTQKYCKRLQSQQQIYAATLVAANARGANVEYPTRLFAFAYWGGFLACMYECVDSRPQASSAITNFINILYIPTSAIAPTHHPTGS